MKLISETLLNLYCCMHQDCPNSYSTKFNLQRHVESVHMRVKRYRCPICSAQFAGRQNLKEHLYIHSGLMPFKCSTCDKYFRQASQLSIHRRVHLAEGKVPECEKVSVNEEIWELKPIDVSFEVDESKFRLPEIDLGRRSETRLPFLSLFF